MVTRQIAVLGSMSGLAVSTVVSLAGNTTDGNRRPLDEKQWEAWWSDLEKGDAPAMRALLELADRPKDAVAFLAKKLKPLTISSAQVKTLASQAGQCQRGRVEAGV